MLILLRHVKIPITPYQFVIAGFGCDDVIMLCGVI